MKMKIYLLTLILFTYSTVFSQGSQSLLVDSLLNELKIKNFNVSYSYKSVPHFVKKGIREKEGKKFIIADKNEDFKSTDFNIKPNLPNKRVIYIGNSDNLMIIVYEQGKFHLPWKMKIIGYENKKVKSVYNLAVPYHDSIESLKILFTNASSIRISDPFE